MKLLDQLRHEIRARHYSERTVEAYVSWCRQYILFHDVRHPSEMGAAPCLCGCAHPGQWTRPD